LALQPGGTASNEVRAYISPQLTVAAIQALSDRLHDRADVSAIQLRSPSPDEVKLNQTGRRFTLIASSAAAVPGLVAALKSTEGITSVESAPAGGVGRMVLSEGGRIALLCGLVVCALLALVLAREGFRALLYAFRHEVRLMRRSGVSEWRILAAVELAGLLMGLLAGALVVVGLVLYNMAASGAEPVLDVTRLTGVAVVSLLLGVLMGGLLGLLGAAHLTSNRFSPIP
jgi:cell division protein FtsX